VTKVVDWSGNEDYEKDARKYFICCPVCGQNNLTFSLIPGGKDTVSYDDCGAAWHLYLGLLGLKWAELELEAENGKGNELLGKRIKNDDIRKLSQKARKGLSQTTKGRKYKQDRHYEGNCKN
jgi:hypothetical protein